MRPERGGANNLKFWQIANIKTLVMQAAGTRKTSRQRAKSGTRKKNC
jgi:hypothetical protein